MGMQVYFIRHGKTVANLEHRYLGKTDEPLCEEGRIELEQKSFSMPKIDFLFASPMLRCKQTCQILFPNDPVVEIEEYQEMDFGDFERKNYEELKDVPAYQKWLQSNGTIAFPHGESREHFIARNIEGFHRMCQCVMQSKEYEKKRVTVAAVVHGGSIMAILSELTGREYFTFQCRNGTGYSFFIDQGGVKDIVPI